jgi:hypothetical protein
MEGRNERKKERKEKLLISGLESLNYLIKYLY